MPIFRIKSDLHYFAHVPKCGGTAVEAYLSDRFGPMALQEHGRHLFPEAARWSRTAVEHVPALWLGRMIPAGWLHSSFAVVRHPWRKVVSAFYFRRDIARSLPPDADFNAFVRGLPDWLDRDPFRHEGHFARQVDMIPEGSKIFRLEKGLDLIIPYLDALAGNSDGPRKIEARNVGKWRHDQKPPVPNDETLSILARLYAEDFNRFGYPAPTRADDLDQLVDLPALAGTGAPPAPGKRTLIQKLHHSLQRRINQP